MFEYIWSEPLNVDWLSGTCYSPPQQPGNRYKNVPPAPFCSDEYTSWWGTVGASLVELLVLKFWDRSSCLWNWIKSVLRDDFRSLSVLLHPVQGWSAGDGSDEWGTGIYWTAVFAELSTIGTTLRQLLLWWLAHAKSGQYEIVQSWVYWFKSATSIWSPMQNHTANWFSHEREKAKLSKASVCDNFSHERYRSQLAGGWTVQKATKWK